MPTANLSYWLAIFPVQDLSTGLWGSIKTQSLNRPRLIIYWTYLPVPNHNLSVMAIPKCDQVLVAKCEGLLGRGKDQQRTLTGELTTHLTPKVCPLRLQQGTGSLSFRSHTRTHGSCPYWKKERPHITARPCLSARPMLSSAGWADGSGHRRLLGDLQQWIQISHLLSPVLVLPA